MKSKVKFTAHRPEWYINNLGGQVRQGASKSAYSIAADGLNSQLIFSENMRRTKFQSAARDNARGYIRLCKPVINTFICGRSGALLKKILGITNTDFKNIKNLDRVLDLKTGELIERDPSYVGDDYLFGASIFGKMIEDFDIEKETKKELLGIVHGVAYKESASDIGTIHDKEVEGSYELLGKYYFKPNPASLGKLKGRFDLEELQDVIVHDYLKSGDERIIYLLNMDKESMSCMITKYLSVLPMGMRPKIENREDYMTKQYGRVIDASNKLELVIRDGSPWSIISQSYKVLEKYVTELLSDRDEKKVNSFSLKDKISGKTALIRGKMLSKRCDYTGRSVITINPQLRIDECGIPEAMIPKLFRSHHLKGKTVEQAMTILENDNDTNFKEIVNEGILDKVPVNLNRAPTLHSLSYQGYKVKPAKGMTIEVNPLCCEAFNADFDGDQMAVNVPVTDEAVEETKYLMDASRNVFKPASGRCIVVPRMEMLHGLYEATDKFPIGKVVGTYKSYEEIRDAVFNQEVELDETVNYKGNRLPAGHALVIACFPEYCNVKITSRISKKTIDSYLSYIMGVPREDFIETLHRLVVVGFELSTLYPPTLTLIGPDIRDEISAPFKVFHEEMEKTTEMFEEGFEEEDTYKLKFDVALDKAEKETEKILATKALGKHDGFKLMAESGARGNTSNLIQIFAYKGRIAKSSTESFHAVIENSFQQQLTSFEHFISAYGSRKGVMDKSLRPGETGYAERLMWHTTSDIVIEEDDCGTTEGLRIDKSEVMMFNRSEVKSDEEIKKAAEDEMIKMIIGRYEAGTNKYITPEYAEKIVRENEYVVIRSPLKCKSMCSKCYGDDLGIHGKAVVGLPVGMIAAQSLGEPMTQMTMKSFQKGGIATKGDVTSTFEKINLLLMCTRIGNNPEKYVTYDPIAWATGDVVESTDPKDPNNKIIRITNTNGTGSSLKRLTMPVEAKIKSHVTKGEGLCEVRGNYDLNELQMYRGVDYTQLYYVLSMYFNYKESETLNLKHFEVLVAGQTLNMVVKTNNKRLKVGQMYSMKEIHRRGGLAGTKLKRVIKSLKLNPILRESPMENILMENISKGIARGILLGNVDDCNSPFASLVLGDKCALGTGKNPNYIKERTAACLIK